MKLGISRLLRPRKTSLHSTAILTTLLVAAVLLQMLSAAHASTSSGMPWDNSLNQITTALTGSVARTIGVVAIFATGAGMAFSEGGTMMRKALWVALGLTLAFNAGTWGLTFLGFTGGLVV